MNVYRRKMERMENGAWRLALGGAKMLDWRCHRDVRHGQGQRLYLRSIYYYYYYPMPAVCTSYTS